MSKNLKYATVALIAIVLGIIAVVIYRLFFQFNTNEIHVYAKEEAAKYKDKSGVYSIILEGVHNILSSHSETQQVLKTAKATNMDKEQLLVSAAINKCIMYGYLPKPINS